MSTVLFQCDHIPAGNARDTFFLHCRNNYRAETLGQHGRLEDVGDQRGRETSAFAEFGNAAIFGKWD